MMFRAFPLSVFLFAALPITCTAQVNQGIDPTTLAKFLSEPRFVSQTYTDPSINESQSMTQTVTFDSCKGTIVQEIDDTGGSVFRSTYTFNVALLSWVIFQRTMLQGTYDVSNLPALHALMLVSAPAHPKSISIDSYVKMSQVPQPSTSSSSIDGVFLYSPGDKSNLIGPLSAYIRSCASSSTGT